jgi:hypothetical protein
MSTLKVTNIQATGETATRAVSGVAAAWVNFNGTTATIRDSLNVASLVDNGTGDFRVNYSSSMANANYAVTFGGKGDSVRVFYTGGNGNWSDPTSTYTEFAAYQESITSMVDAPYHFGATHGDLA